MLTRSNASSADTFGRYADYTMLIHYAWYPMLIAYADLLYRSSVPIPYANSLCRQTMLILFWQSLCQHYADTLCLNTMPQHYANPVRRLPMPIHCATHRVPDGTHCHRMRLKLVQFERLTGRLVRVVNERTVSALRLTDDRWQCKILADACSAESFRTQSDTIERRVRFYWTAGGKKRRQKSNKSK